MADTSIDTISLHTNNGSTGYRIKKLSIIDGAPGTAEIELVCKVYSTPQTTADGLIDFSDNTLLAVGYYTESANVAYPGFQTVIFDNMTFNQDIYVTAVDVASSGETNYYIELEQVKLDLGENTVATLKDIRNKAVP
jgi:hypothetical protein